MMTMSVLIRSNPFSMAEVARPISRKSLGFVRSKAMASISSNKIINFSGWENPLISLNSSDKFFCVWPSLLSITAEKSTIKISLLRILASCLTASVFPVPGSPWKRNLLIPIWCEIALTMPSKSCVIVSGSKSIFSVVSSRSKNVESYSFIWGINVFVSESRDIMYSANW